MKPETIEKLERVVEDIRSMGLDVYSYRFTGKLIHEEQASINVRCKCGDMRQTLTEADIDAGRWGLLKLVGIPFKEVEVMKGAAMGATGESVRSVSSPEEAMKLFGWHMKKEFFEGHRMTVCPIDSCDDENIQLESEGDAGGGEGGNPSVEMEALVMENKDIKARLELLEAEELVAEQVDEHLVGLVEELAERILALEQKCEGFEKDRRSYPFFSKP